MNERIYWVWLTMIFGPGSSRIWKVMNTYRDVRTAYEQLCSGAGYGELSSRMQRNLKNVRLEDAERLIERCGEKGVSLICYSDEDYPVVLRYITNPPAVLYYMGDIGCLRAEHSVSAVGARKSGEYTLSVTQAICRQLAENGVLIVSGFALGVDIAAHIAAAGAGFPTACVLGCGLDINYPKENNIYRSVILESGGVMITEYPLGTTAFAPNFPKRNRILSALGDALIVFEATLKSGSLVTAQLASEQGREIFCLPPRDVFSDNYAGNISLLRNGAIPLYDAQDIMDFFGIVKMPEREEKEVHISSFAEEMDLPAGKRSAKKAEGNSRGADKNKAENKPGNKEQSSASAELPEGLSDTQRSIAELLRGGAVHADEIAVRLGMEQTELMTELTVMEISGTVRQKAGKMFELC